MKEKIEKLIKENEEMGSELEEREKDIQKLKERPLLKEDQMIVLKNEWTELNNDKEVLTQRVDELESNLSKAREAAMPENQKKELAQKNAEIVKSFKDMKDEQGDEFANPSNATEWNKNEVCYWLTTIGMDEYVPTFDELNIDGYTLIKSKTAEFLEMNVKRVHALGMLKEIKAQLISVIFQPFFFFFFFVFFLLFFVKQNTKKKQK